MVLAASEQVEDATFKLVPFEPLGVHLKDMGLSPNCRYYLRLRLDDQVHAKADPLRYPQRPRSMGSRG
jgi:hypothetical protein